MTPGGSFGRPPVAVTFDFWHTLAVPLGDSAAQHRARRLVHLLAEVTGVDAATIGAEIGVAGVKAAMAAHSSVWSAGEAFSWDAAADDVAAAVGLPIADPRLRRRIEEVFSVFPDGIVPPLAPNVAGAVRTLADAGLRLGIICDVGLQPATSLRGALEVHGLLDAFAHTSFSDEVGVFKPDPRMFAHALAGLRVSDPSSAVHIGDLRRTDVAGARAAGLGTVRYCGVADDAGRAEDGSNRIEADVVLADMAELPAALGLT